MKKLKLLKEQPELVRGGRKKRRGVRDVMLPNPNIRVLAKVQKEEREKRRQRRDGSEALVPATETPVQRRTRGLAASRLKRLEKLEEMSLLENFPKMFLGLTDVYDWQLDVLRSLDPKESRVALKAANGSGKTSVCVASAILWHMARFPGSLAVSTAGVWRQVEGQLWPCLKGYIRERLGEGWRATNNELEYVNGSRAIGFSTNDPGKFEGWHRQGPTENLLMIVDEAKTVPDPIYDAIARCQPSRLLVVSSPGASAGQFYEIFTKQRDKWDTYTVTAHDCPHLSAEWIREQIEIYGEGSPLVRSMIYGEFVDDAGEGLVISLKDLEGCLLNPPEREDGVRTAFVDFAAGGDECVFALRSGNKVTELACWRERDTNVTIGKVINLMDRHGLTGEEIYADEGGLGLPMCDALAEAGHDVHRVNFGAKAYDDRYQNRGAEMWHSAARAIQKKEVILPDDSTLHQQMVTRRVEVSRTGKLGVEPKDRMRARGLDSPDRADAVLGCIACGGGIGTMWEQYRQVTRPSIDDLYEQAASDYENDSLPAGMSAGG